MIGMYLMENSLSSTYANRDVVSGIVGLVRY